MKEILLFSNILNIHLREYSDYVVDMSNVYSPKIPEAIIKIAKRSFVANNGILYNGWKNHIREYDRIVIIDPEANKGVLRYLSKVAGDRVVLCYLNKINTRELKLYKEAAKLGIKQATYNIHDAAKYGIKYVPQFWNCEYKEYAKQNNAKWDIVFCGMAKSRLQDILKIKSSAEGRGLKTNFWIVSDKSTKYTQKERKSYIDYLRDVGNSAAILDIVGEDNWGLTWRPLEALFCRKKLITNYTDIVKYDFFEPYKKNIFVVKNGNCVGLKEFVEKEYDPVDLDLKEYDAQNWLDNIVDLKC